MKTKYIGIDWSREFIDIVIIDEKENLLHADKIFVTKEGFNNLSTILKKHKKNSILVAGIESCNHIIIGYLHDLKIPIHEINPRKINRFKEIYSLTGQKDDRYDAKMIALYLIKNIKTNIKAKTDNETSSKLKMLNSALDSLKKDRARLINRLKNNLQHYFPYFSRCFRDITKPVLQALIIIESPGNLSTLSLDEYLMKTEGIRWSLKRKTYIFEKLSSESPDYVSPIQNQCIEYTNALIQQINIIDLQIEKFESSIESLFNNHEGSKILKSIPAVGTTIGGVLLSELTNEELDFQDYRAFQSYAGTSPVTKQSGKTIKKTTMRYSCNKNLRHAMYWLAFNSISRIDWAREYYNSQKSKGKKNSMALRALSNKWAKIIFSMWKHQTLFSPDFKKTERKKDFLLTSSA